MIDFDPGTAAAPAGDSAPAGARNGGDLVVETLEALGAKTVFGIPGQHALGLFDAMGRGNLQFVSSRVENNSAFAADGYSRATGEVGVLFLSTGPGALTSLAGLQEAYATGVPMVVVASQIPLEGLGAALGGRHLVAGCPQAVAHEREDHLVVVDDEHRALRGRDVLGVVQQGGGHSARRRSRVSSRLGTSVRNTRAP